MDWLRRVVTCILIFALLYSACSLLLNRSPFDLINGKRSNETWTLDDVHTVYTTLVTLPIILFLAYAFGAVTELFDFPGLIGMFAAGLLLDLSFFHGALDVHPYASTTLRKIAFIVILVRGGLSLDANQLKKFKATCLTLSIVPSTIEMVVVAVFSMFLLEMDFMSSLAAGALLAAVSPAVVVPCMLEVERRGYGTSNGVTTLIIASATVNDVFAVAVFTVLLGMIFSTERSILSLALHAPLEIIMGIVIGIVGGFTIIFFTKFKSPYISLARTVLLILSSICALFGSSRLGSESMGAVAVLALSFVTSQRMWKMEESKRQMKHHLDILWKFIFQQLLFALLAFMCHLRRFDTKEFLLGVAVLMIGVIMRTAITFCVVHGGLSQKERLFVAISWIPKATVQAALAPAFLEMARSKDPSLENMGKLVLMLGIASILFTAPLGSFLIRKLTPKLLTKDVILVSEDERPLQLVGPPQPLTHS